jgi:hydroxymethylbilane synthase
LAQTKIVADRLRAVHRGLKVETVPRKTLGDLMPPEKRGKVDGKSAFTGEIERQLLAGSIDAAVHSMKDLPTELDDRLVIGATPVRGDPRDVLVSSSGLPLARLGRGARIGTSSVRRRAQLLCTRSDLQVLELHGNLETRLRKMEEELDGVVLAAAGLERLGLESRISEYFNPEKFIPAVCQGTLAVEARKDDPETLVLLKTIDDPATRASSECEREFSRRLGGDCYVPLGAYAKETRGTMTSVGMVASTDGKQVAKVSIKGPPGKGEELGAKMAERLLESGGKRILRELTS